MAIRDEYFYASHGLNVSKRDDKQKNYRDVITKMDPKQLAIFLCMSQDPEGWQDDKEHIQEVYNFLTETIEKPVEEYNKYYSELAKEYLGD